MIKDLSVVNFQSNGANFFGLEKFRINAKNA